MDTRTNSDFTISQLSAMTVGQVWRECGQDKAVITPLVMMAAAHVAAEHGFALPTTEQEQALFAKAAEAQLTIHTGGLFTDVIAKAFAAMHTQAPMPDHIVAGYNAGRTCADKRSLCHAPATSMYFGNDGFVSACCYSRFNTFGRIPDDTIADIWFGRAIADMRAQLQSNVLPFGCEKCADQLAAGNHKGLLAGNFDPFAAAPVTPGLMQKLTAVWRKPQPVYPVSMEFELSNKCNLECDMCTGAFSSLIREKRENKPPLPDMYGADFVKQLEAFVPHLREAKFLGGEPFLIDIYYEIWDLLIAKNPACNINITTNGTAFSTKIERVLEKLNCQIIISLDSLDKGRYERIRRNATLERTLANVERFLAFTVKRGRPLALAACPMTTNWQDVPALLDFANARGATLFFNTVHYPESLSLRYAPASDQQRMVEELTDAVDRTTPATAIQANNVNAVNDLKRQVEAWLRDRANTEAMA